MTNPELFLPESMQPIVDVRSIAADLSYAHWLLRVSKGEIPEEAEAEYTRPEPGNFDSQTAYTMVHGVMAWAFASPSEGLLKLASSDGNRVLLGRAATLGTSLQGLDIGTVNSLIGQFKVQEDDCYEVYKVDRGPHRDEGDITLLREVDVARHASWILSDLVIDGNQGSKEVFFSGRVDDGWAKSLGQA